MIKPTLHINGTSRDYLAERYSAAQAAIIGAIDAIMDAAPNARDYYPQGEHAFSQAAREHAERVRALCKIKADLDEFLAHVVG